MGAEQSPEPYNGGHEHLRLINHEITTEEYVAGLKDHVDRVFGYGKHRGRPEGLAVKPRKPSLLKRLGNLYIEAFNPYRGIDLDEPNDKNT